MYRKAIKVHLAYAVLNPLAAANVGLINIKMKWHHTSCILLGVENLYSFVTEARFARGGVGVAVEKEINPNYDFPRHGRLMVSAEAVEEGS